MLKTFRAGDQPKRSCPAPKGSPNFRFRRFRRFDHPTKCGNYHRRAESGRAESFPLKIEPLSGSGRGRAMRSRLFFHNVPPESPPRKTARYSRCGRLRARVPNFVPTPRGSPKLRFRRFRGFASPKCGNDQRHAEPDGGAESFALKIEPVSGNGRGRLALPAFLCLHALVGIPPENPRDLSPIDFALNPGGQLRRQKPVVRRLHRSARIADMRMMMDDDPRPRACRLEVPYRRACQAFCVAANIRRRTHCRWLETDNAYKGASEWAEMEAAQVLEPPTHSARVPVCWTVPSYYITHLVFQICESYNSVELSVDYGNGWPASEHGATNRKQEGSLR